MCSAKIDKMCIANCPKSAFPGQFGAFMLRKLDSCKHIVDFSPYLSTPSKIQYMKKMKKERKQYKINPSLEVIGHFIYEGKKLIRTKGTREGIVAGKPEQIISEERIKTLQDRSAFIKFFMDSDSIQEFIELSSSAQRIVAHIIKYHLEFNKSYVYLTIKELESKLDLGRSSISIGFNELLDREWLYKSDIPYKYWLNISFICYGNREDIYEEFKNTVLQ